MIGSLAFASCGALLGRVSTQSLVEHGLVTLVIATVGCVAVLGLLASNARARASGEAGPEPLPGLIRYAVFVGGVAVTFAAISFLMEAVTGTVILAEILATAAVSTVLPGTAAVLLQLVPISRSLAPPLTGALAICALLLLML